MTSCRQATSRCLRQCLLRSISPNGITRLQLVKGHNHVSLLHHRMIDCSWNGSYQTISAEALSKVDGIQPNYPAYINSRKTWWWILCNLSTPAPKTNHSIHCLTAIYDRSIIVVRYQTLRWSNTSFVACHINGNLTVVQFLLHLTTQNNEVIHCMLFVMSIHGASVEPPVKAK